MACFIQSSLGSDALDGVEVSFPAACAVRRPASDTDELAVFFASALFDDPELAAVLRSVRAQVVADAGIMPSYLVPVPRAVIPKTTIGKIQRAQLKRRLEAGEFDSVVKRTDVLTGSNVIPDWFYRKAAARRREVGQQGVRWFLFINGLHRSGTPIIHRLLREHPEVSGFADTGVPEDEGQHLQSVFAPAYAFGNSGVYSLSIHGRILSRTRRS